MRNIPDFPKLGILYRDITTILEDTIQLGNSVLIVDDLIAKDGTAAAIAELLIKVISFAVSINRISRRFFRSFAKLSNII